MTTRRILLGLAVVFFSSAAGAQVATPAERCPFEGFGPEFPLAIAVRSTETWVLCPPNGGCRTSPLKAGEPIAVYHTQGSWTCAGLPGGPGWVRSGDLRTLVADATPPLRSWVGSWNGGAGRVTIQQAKAAGALTLSGRGTWNGANGVVHSGRFGGDASPRGNRLHFSDGYCEIDLALIGGFITASDNAGCGGLNVSFSGIWKRVP